MGVIPSPKNMLAHIAKVNIPAANPSSLPGHITPSNAINPNRVASIYNQLIGIPNRHSRNILFFIKSRKYHKNHGNFYITMDFIIKFKIKKL